MTRGSLWPTLTHINWLLKSRYRLPSGVQKYTPFERAIGIGSTCDCADHSKNVCRLHSSTISALLIVPFSVVVTCGHLSRKCVQAEHTTSAAAAACLLYNGPLSSADPRLSIVAARLERLTDPSPFLNQLRREVDALGIPSEVIAVSPDPRGFGHELRAGLRRARAPYIITVDPDFSGP